MTEKKRLTHFGVIALSATLLASIAFFEEACNTSQAPSRQVSDSQITAEVKAKLASGVSPSSLTNIDVNTTNGIVTLTGQVESADEKQDAEKVTGTVQRVLRINNNLQVASAAPVER